jgi:hypothetical protein
LFAFFEKSDSPDHHAAVGAASTSPEIAVEVYTFTGQRTDCTGTGWLILLADYL